MSFDQLINFGKVQVSIGYDASATSIALSAGDGAKLPSTFNYNVVWWNFTDYADPADALHAGEAEIVRVTNRSTDTLTITRAQEGTSAVTHNTSAKTYKMALALTKKMIDDITIAATDTVQTTDATQTTLDSFALTDENTYHVEALVTAVQSTGAGSATLQGAVTVVHANESDANLDCTFTVNSNDLRLSVTGIAAETWEWDGRLTRINGSNA